MVEKTLQILQKQFPVTQKDAGTYDTFILEFYNTMLDETAENYKNYMELLEPFKALGEHKGKQLLKTLETFVLDAGMNSGKTSEFMGIHTNTVQYRLKKINEILGAEITGNRVIPGLTIALALRRLEDTAK